MLENGENFLPIGSLVTVVGGKNLYCVIGYYPIGKDDNLCNYVICNAAYGIVGEELGIIDTKMIDEVVIRGYEDFSFKTFKKDFIATVKDIANKAGINQNQEGE